MILGSDEIRKRLDNGEIFHPTTWDEGSIKEASYALRVANDGMIIDGETFAPGERDYPKPLIEIKAGSIAILSTVERLCMPGDLVGKLGIRLDFASKGLTGLMGIQVDPYYGQDRPGERLYIRVANFGNEAVKFRPFAPVFNIEFSLVTGAAPPAQAKRSTWERLIDSLADQEHSDWTYVTRVQSDLGKRADNLESDVKQQVSRDLDSIRENQQSVVMFGVFLVAITILGVSLALLFSVDDAPNWITNWGWIALFVLFSFAMLSVTGFVIVTGYVFWKASNKRSNWWKRTGSSYRKASLH